MLCARTLKFCDIIECVCSQWVEPMGARDHLPQKEIEISQNMFYLCFWALSMFDVTTGEVGAGGV
jgi:hypothetical protein